MPIDVDLLREYKGGDPNKVRASERKRRAAPDTVDEAIRLDRVWAGLVTETNEANKAVNDFQTQIQQNMKAEKRAPTDEEKARIKELKAAADALKARVAEAEIAREAAVLRIGNVLHDSVPDFAREEDGEVCVTSWGEFKSPEGVLMHNQALWMIGGFEPEKGSVAAGHRGYYLRGPGVILNQALIRYALDYLMERGFEPVQPPYFMTKSAMAKVSQLSDFDESLYHVGSMHRGGAENEEDDKYLIATSEQPLCCFHMEEHLSPTQLPLKYAGFSSCFRREAGKFGVDTLGIFRVHQFDKVEQFVVTAPDETVSYAMLEQMRENAENFLKSLELPFKTINVVSGELNLAAAKKYDINAWFPSLKQHKELVSASNCTDYQSRATNTYTQHDGKKKHVHLLNATLCALTRTICCIVENHQGEKTMEDGTKKRGVFVPKVLLPYTSGRDFFPFIRDAKQFDKQAPANKTEARKKGEEKDKAGAEAKPAPAPARRRSSFKVGAEEFPTEVQALANKAFKTLEEYIAFLKDVGAASAKPAPAPASE